MSSASAMVSTDVTVSTLTDGCPWSTAPSPLLSLLVLFALPSPLRLQCSVLTRTPFIHSALWALYMRFTRKTGDGTQPIALHVV